MNLNALKVDPEFQGKIPPLTFEELNQLEANILRDGRIINPIIVWEGLIVDGHNRFIIAKKHPEIPYTVHETEFANRYEAIIWICKNQLGRRNLTPEQKKYLIGKQYEAENVPTVVIEKCCCKIRLPNWQPDSHFKNLSKSRQRERCGHENSFSC